MTLENNSKNFLIITRLKNILKSKFKPVLLRENKEYDSIIFLKPLELFSSKHPFTVRVSNP